MTHSDVPCGIILGPEAKERLANLRREAGAKGGGGDGGRGTKHVSARNNGPRNTMGMRCMQPRSGGM